MPRGRRPTESPSKPSNAGRAAFGITELGNEPVKGAPRLPRARAGRSWSAETRAWWESWRRAAVASQFLETDWQHLALLAYTVEAYFAKPNNAMLGVIMQGQAKLGATVDDRMRLRLKVRKAGEVPEAAAEPAAPAGPKARRQKGDPRRLQVVS